jgi:hypothetical protein
MQEIILQHIRRRRLPNHEVRHPKQGLTIIPLRDLALPVRRLRQPR